MICYIAGGDSVVKYAYYDRLGVGKQQNYTYTGGCIKLADVYYSTHVVLLIE